ncbi:MAG: hypothetical protein HYY04_05990 [Chloroflexi bacterium]|nr:hypothetical protein [Chloroflexota bacterium]
MARETPAGDGGTGRRGDAEAVAAVLDVLIVRVGSMHLGVPAFQVAGLSDTAGWGVGVQDGRRTDSEHRAVDCHQADVLVPDLLGSLVKARMASPAGPEALTPCPFSPRERGWRLPFPQYWGKGLGDEGGSVDGEARPSAWVLVATPRGTVAFGIAEAVAVVGLARETMRPLPSLVRAWTGEIVWAVALPEGIPPLLLVDLVALAVREGFAHTFSGR